MGSTIGGELYHPQLIAMLERLWGGPETLIVVSSDLSHWDVPDMLEVVKDAYRLVEHGLLTREQFRDWAMNAAGPAAIAGRCSSFRFSRDRMRL